MLDQFRNYKIEATFVKSTRGTCEKTKRKNAQRGCLNAHCKIIKEAQQLQFENVCVLEDDIWIHQEYETFLEDLRWLPEDWDLIYLSWSHIHNKTNYLHVKKNLYRVYQANDTSGYIIRRKLYPLFDTIKEGPVPIDYALAEASLKHKMYCLLTKENLKQLETKRGRLYMGPFKQDRKTFGSNIASNF